MKIYWVTTASINIFINSTSEGQFRPIPIRSCGVIYLQQYCVCFVFSSHPFWTSSSLDVPAGVTQEEGHTGFLIHLPSAVRALIFVARRIQPFLSLVDREVEFCVVVVVDSHIQRIVLATEETTVTQQVSHRPIKCQSRLWSQRGTKVNGSHHGDNPLLRPTGIQIATKSYAALQAMAPTNIKTVHQTSLLHIESNLDRLGMLSPTHDQRSQQKTGKITLQPVLINKSKFLKATHFVQK